MYISLVTTFDVCEMSAIVISWDQRSTWFPSFILSYLILLVQSQQQKQLEKSVKYVQTPELRQCQVIKVGWFFQN